MSQLTLNCDQFASVNAEHEELREQLARIHDVYLGMSKAPREIKALLNDFEETLLVHFANEEMGDSFFDAVVRRAPSLAWQADRLRMEHHILRSQVAELCQFAASGNSTMPWWRELASRCHVLSQKLLRHESAEIALQQLASHRHVSAASDERGI